MKLKNKTYQITITYLLLILLLCLLVLLNICSGSVDFTVTDVLNGLWLHRGDEMLLSIIWDIRMPRIAAAILLGGALAVSGFLLQTFFNNPIAGPYVLGISSGAKLCVALLLVYVAGRGMMISSFVMVVTAFIGSMISMGFVLVMAGKVRNKAMLIVCGIMIGYICSAITEFVITFSNDSNIVNLHNWSMGSFSGMNWEQIQICSVIIIPVMVLTFLCSKPIGAFLMGEAYARNMGVNIKVLRILMILLSSILSAAVTAFAGPISFVGIAVPHVCKSFLKTAKPIFLIPALFLGGASFCLLCDLLVRTLFAPTEISISSMTAVFGAPIVIYRMTRKKSGV